MEQQGCGRHFLARLGYWDQGSLDSLGWDGGGGGDWGGGGGASY